MYNPEMFRLPTREDWLDMRNSLDMRQIDVYQVVPLSINTIHNVESCRKQVETVSVAILLGFYQSASLSSNKKVVPDPFEFTVLTGEDVMDMRNAIKMDRRALADKAGVSLSTLREFELRGRSPRIYTYQNILYALNQAYEEYEEEDEE